MDVIKHWMTKPTATQVAPKRRAREEQERINERAKDTKKQNIVNDKLAADYIAFLNGANEDNWRILLQQYKQAAILILREDPRLCLFTGVQNVQAIDM